MEASKGGYRQGDCKRDGDIRLHTHPRAVGGMEARASSVEPGLLPAAVLGSNVECSSGIGVLSTCQGPKRGLRGISEGPFHYRRCMLPPMDGRPFRWCRQALHDLILLNPNHEWSFVVLLPDWLSAGKCSREGGGAAHWSPRTLLQQHRYVKAAGPGLVAYRDATSSEREGPCVMASMAPHHHCCLLHLCLESSAGLEQGGLREADQLGCPA